MKSEMVLLLVMMAACGSSGAAPDSGSGGGAGGVGIAGAAGTSGGGAAEMGGGTGGVSGAGATCTAARAQLLGAVDMIASGNVAVLDDNAGVTTLAIDATAGGAAMAAMNPWIFVALGTGAKVPVTDVTSTSSSAWDLALKRANLYTNGGHAGPGHGAAVLLAKSFDSVTGADATSATFATETLFDAECNPNVDETGAAKTTFAGWYAYDEATHMLSPAAGTWLVRGASGDVHKVEIQTYYAPAPGADAGMGASGNYRLRVAAL